MRRKNITFRALPGAIIFLPLIVSLGGCGSGSSDTQVLDNGDLLHGPLQDAYDSVIGDINRKYERDIFEMQEYYRSGGFD